jgi:predicted enzyme related to lactoylglutathione lyase
MSSEVHGEAVARVGAIMIDCRDPDRLAHFWGAITNTTPEFVHPDYIFMTKLPGNHVRLAFQRVPEEKVVKNRVHLDVGYPDLDAFAARVVDLGGSVGERHEMAGTPWIVLADPEGNEFCVAPPHEDGNS